MKKDKRTYGGIGFCGLLTIAFVCFKILGYIDWSWWMVFAPMYAPFLIALAIMGICLLIMMAIE